MATEVQHDNRSAAEGFKRTNPKTYRGDHGRHRPGHQASRCQGSRQSDGTARTTHRGAGVQATISHVRRCEGGRMPACEGDWTPACEGDGTRGGEVLLSSEKSRVTGRSFRTERR